MREFRPENPPHIPDYTLLRPIGRGAYGEVWLARNVMGTLRAIKIIWRAQFDSERPFERELAGIQKYEPVSRTSGGLVHVLHVGRNDPEGYFFYVMELADSVEAFSSAIEKYKPRTLRSDLQRTGALPVSSTFRVAFDVVSGLAQLHRRGLVHRDVKPGNIIYVNDRAKLADIGLVSAGGEGRTFVGTEGYIPPEGPGTPAADLYALGMVLYEASTGFPPERFPDIPPGWVTSEKGDDSFELHEVVLKACEGQRERRYRDADEMQADLALLQSGQSVRQMRALKMRYVRLRASVAAGAILLVLSLLALFMVHYRARVAAESEARETDLRRQAQDALRRTGAAERDARRQLYNALLEQALATVRSSEVGQRVRALEAIQRAATLANTAELRGAALAALALPDLRLERELPLPQETTASAVSPDFGSVAICRGAAPVEIWSLPSGNVLRELAPSTNTSAYSVWWSADSRFVAIKRDRPKDNALFEVWNVTTGQQTLLHTNLDSDGIAFHPRLPRILASA
ncbi:MAG TPA: serine/threonine-protein kinase, partial [Verrucomicrobiae bacterium]|nr:serine/threonine-protein kinase [Verrucomicrobiae bacterium]